MLIRNPNTPARVVLLTSALCWSAVAFAGLKEKPPKGVVLTGLWQIDPYRSDDPKAVLDKAREDAHESSSSGGGRANRGIFGGGGGTWGRSGSGGEGTWGGDDSDFPSRGGGGGRHGGMGRHGGCSSSSADGSKRSGWKSDQLADLNANPEKLSFEDVNQHLKVSAGENSTECAAGVKVAISDSAGDGERTCGWDGRAWVIETTRGKNFTRTDRYELSKDGSTLTYVTTANGSRLPKIKISRTYIVASAPPKPPGV